MRLLLLAFATCCLATPQTVTAPAGYPAVTEIDTQPGFNPDTVKVTLNGRAAEAKVDWHQPRARISFLSLAPADSDDGPIWYDNEGTQAKPIMRLRGTILKAKLAGHNPTPPIGTETAS